MKFGNIRIERIVEAQFQNEENDDKRMFLKDLKDNLCLDSHNFLKRYKKYCKFSFYKIFNDVFNNYSITDKRILLYDFINMYGNAGKILDSFTIDYFPTMNITIREMLDLRIGRIENDKWPELEYYKSAYEILYNIIELEENDFYNEIQRRKIYKFSSQVEYIVCDELEYLSDLVNDSGEAIDMTIEQIVGNERWLRDREECPYNQKKYIKDKE